MSDLIKDAQQEIDAYGKLSKTIANELILKIKHLQAQPSPASLIAAAIREKVIIVPEQYGTTDYQTGYTNGYEAAAVQAAQIAEQYSTVTLEPVGWAAQDYDENIVSMLKPTKEKMDNYIQAHYERCVAADIRCFLDKPVQLYRARDEK